MDLIAITPTYEEVGLIEGYDTLGWTERFTDLGEFSLTTTDIEVMRSKLPMDYLVRTGDSPYLCIVENHNIETDDDGLRTLTISGRSFESIYDRRSYPALEQSLALGHQSPKAIVFDILNVYNGYFPNPIELFQPDIVSQYDTNDKAPYDYVPEIGPLSDQLQKVRTAEKLGILPRLMELTDFEHVIWPDAKVNLVVYEGVDRTVNQGARPQVVFSALTGEFDDDNYLFSNQIYKNVCYAMSSNGLRGMAWAPGPNIVDQTQYTGLNRRIHFADASDIDIAGLTNDQVISLLNTRARFELAQHNKAVLLQGKVAGSSPLKYRTDYGLGDLVTVAGNYGVNTDMRVVEYIRTQDKNGEVSYPTLVVDG